jgi:predicted DNA-binding ribbon-helix-helix protein
VGAASLRKRSIMVAGHATSVSLEAEFWAELAGAAERRGVSVNRLVAEIDATRAGNLSSALRLFVLVDLQERLGDLQERLGEGRG